MLKKRSAYRVLARRASGAHVLNGPIMLHRMAKRVWAAEHHSRHPIASRCGRSTGRALQRPPRPRFASSRRALLTRVGLAHHPARTVACCVGEVRPVAERHAFGPPRPPSRCHPMGGTGRSRRGLARRWVVSTSKALRTRAACDHVLVGPVPICFRPARELALQHDLCDRCSTRVRGRGGGAGEALFRRLLDPRRACPQHDWASGYSVRPSRSTPGRWSWLYRPCEAFIHELRKSERFCITYSCN